jgi:hypothetical protein
MYRVADNRCQRGAEENAADILFLAGSLIPRRVVLRNKASDHDLLAVQELHMLDAIMIAIALGFFALSIGYTVACDRL